jgi:hypothetical protein
MAIRMNRRRILTRHSNIEYRPLHLPILLANYAGPQIRRIIAMAIVNVAVMAPAAAYTDGDTHHNEGPSNVVSPVEVTGPPARRCVSLPNISISVTPIEIEMLQISADDSYNAALIIVKNKRGSFWKQTKRFFRRLICCCA